MELSADILDVNRKISDTYISVLSTIAVVILLGIAGNIISIIFYGFTKTQGLQQNVTYFLITALATNDLAACCSECSIFYEMRNIVNFRYRWGCVALYAFNHWLIVSSLFLLAFIAVDRYRRICLSSTAWQVTIPVARKVFAGISLFSMALACQYILTVDVTQFPIDIQGNQTILGTYCTHSRKSSLHKTIFTLHLIDLIIVLIISTILLTMYTKVTQKLRQVATRPHSTNTDIKVLIETRLVIMMITVTCVSVLTFAPYLYATIVIRPTREDRDELMSVTEQFMFRSYVLNCSINPYIMGLTNTQFRKFLARSICRCFKTDRTPPLEDTEADRGSQFSTLL